MVKSHFNGIAAIFLILTLIASCGGGSGTIPLTKVEIEGKDKDVYSSFLRISYDLLPEEEKRKSKSIDFEMSRGQGESSQYIGSSEYINLDRTSLYGPATVDHKYDVSTGLITLRWGFWLKEKLGFEWMAGMGQATMELELTSNGLIESEKIKRTGVYVGTQISYRPLSPLSIYGRASVIGNKSFSLPSYEIGTEVDLISALSVYGGWRWWKYHYNRNYDSDIEIELSGPMAGLLFNF